MTLVGGSAVRRARHELVQYFMVCAYLYVCFGALLLYKASILRAHGIAFEFYGIAFIKALVLGKFVLVGHALKIGGTGRSAPLAWHIFVKSVLFMILLVALNIVEEVVSALIHGHAAREGIANVAGGSFPEVMATSFIVLLILVPYIAWREVALEVGQQRLLQLMLNPHSELSARESPAKRDQDQTAVRS